MLPKINRIKKKKDFDLIFKKGKSLKTSLLVLKMMKNGFEYNRFAFIISQKISKKAATRNKIRRRLSEIIRAHFVGLSDNKDIGTDFVFIGLPGIEKKDFLEIKNSVKSLLIKSQFN